MSAPASHFDVRGWCPGALRPMESGDGLIVRIRPRAATLSAADLRGIADAAERFGNGHIDVTRRANLQIRGVSETTLVPMQRALAALDLLDESIEAEAVRNILVSPLAGLDPTERLDMRPLACELADRLADLADIALPAKFAFVLDGGGRLGLAGERADIRLLACCGNDRTMIAIARETQWLGITEPENATSVLLAIITGKAPSLQPVETLSVQNSNFVETSPGIMRLGAERTVIALGVPFGRLGVDQLRLLCELSAEIRLSPWRMLYLPAPDMAAARQLIAAVREGGFVTEPDDPLMRIQACPGRPACRSAYARTRDDAAMIARLMGTTGFAGTVHVSGCAKGCATSAVADLTLIGVLGGYRVLRSASARDEGGNFSARAGCRGHGHSLDGGREAWLIAAISATARRSIDSLSRSSGLKRIWRAFPVTVAKVVVRMIHACGMPEIARDIVISDGFVAAARAALLAGAPILCDSKMVANGITLARLPKDNAVVCTLSSPEVPALAEELKTTRSAAALELWRRHLAGALVAIGNAPTALFHLLEMLDDGAPHPAAIIGLPVGFVGASESKAALAADGRVPYLVLHGRKGGSAMAVAAVNALASEAE